MSETEDVRYSATVGAEILRFVQSQGVQSVAMVDRIIGCPHEEGTEYPEGQSCPRCPFWAHRERWSGEIRH